MSNTEISDFFNFVHARQELFMRRFEDGLASPWINDLALTDYHYTNVYRELDRGTVFYIVFIGDKNVAPLDSPFGEYAYLKYFCTLMYRLFNRIETYSEIIKQLINFETGWNKDFVLGVLKGMQERGESIFTNAFMVTGSVYPGMNKATQMVTALDNIWKHYDEHYERLIKSKTLEEAWVNITLLPGFGPFLAYEVVCDLMYTKIIPFTEDDWVNIGPGARKGLREIFGTYEIGDMTKYISYLRNDQRAWLDSLGFRYLNGKELTLRNIEHSLCEYSKYCRAKRGERMKRRWRGPAVDDGWYRMALYNLYGIGKTKPLLTEKVA